MHIPDFYEHYCPTKIVAGQRAISNLPFEMGRFGPKKAMVVADKTVADSGFLRLVEQAFADSDHAIGAVFTTSNGTAGMRTARAISGMFSTNGCDCFISIGSGHTMDAVKAASLMAAYGGQDLPGQEAAAKGNRPARIFAVPVTYTPGFQVTDLVQVYDEDKKAWVYARSEALLPFMAVIDPKAAYRAAPRAKAAYAMDALCRAVEAAVAHGSNPVVGIYSHTAIELIRKYLAGAMNGGTAAKAADKAMANASLYAGIAFTHTSQGIVAAASHALNLTSNMEPGVAGAILLPHAMDFYADVYEKGMAGLAGALAVSSRFLSPTALSGLVRDGLRELHALSGLPESLKETGLLRTRLKEAAELAASEACPYFSASAFSVKDVAALLEKAF